jgi:hypothetical protein
VLVIAAAAIAMAIAFILPDGNPFMIAIAIVAGGAFGALHDPIVLLIALLSGLIVRHLFVAVGVAALFGVLLQLLSIYGFHEHAFRVILARSIGLLVAMAVAAVISLLWRSLASGRPRASRDRALGTE